MSSIIDITDRNNKIVVTEADFSEYVFEVDVFNIANAFDITLSNINSIEPSEIQQWYGVTFKVVNTVVFRGIIQRIELTGEKGSVEVRISGKNRASILVESYCTNFKDFRNATPIAIIDKLIQQTNFYPQPVSNAQTATASNDWDDSLDIDAYNDFIENSIRENKAFLTVGDITITDSSFDSLPAKSHFKIEAGDIVFEKINELVRSTGLDMMYQPDGTLFFGDISKKRLNEQPRINYKIYLYYTQESLNNVVSWNISRDTSSLYSSVTVISQNQNGTNKSATVTDSTVLDKKAMIAQINDDNSSAEKEAIRIREDNKIASLSAQYVVPSHIDETGQVYLPNRSIFIYDDVNNLNGEFVLYSTVYRFSLSEGYITELEASYDRRKGVNV